MEKTIIHHKEAIIRWEKREAEGKPASRNIGGKAIVFYDPNNQGTAYRWDAFDWKVEERIMPGALDGAEMGDVVALFNHDHNQLLGRTTAGTLQLTRSLSGLDYAITLGDSPAAATVWDALSRGELNGSSFAFTVREDAWIENPKEKVVVREIRKLDTIYDVGPVVWPAYAGTSAQTRSRIEEMQRRSLEASATKNRNLREIIEILGKW